MRKIGRRILILAAGLAALLVLAAVAALLLVDAEAIRPAVQAGLSEAVGRPVEIGPLSVRPGLGVWVRAASLDLPVPADGSSTLGFRAEDLRVRVGLPALLRGEVNVRTVRFERGVLRSGDEAVASGLALRGKLRRGRDGAARFSGSVTGRADGLALDGAEVEFAVTMRGHRLDIERLDARAGQAAIQADGAVTGLDRDSPETDLRARGRFGSSSFEGTFRILAGADRTHVEFELSSPFVNLDEVSRILGWVEDEPGSAPRSSAGPIPAAHAAEPPSSVQPSHVAVDATGTLRAERARFSGLELTGFRTRVELRRGVLDLDDAQFSFCGGAHVGRLRAILDKEGLPFEIDSDIAGVDVDALMEAFSPGRGGLVRGTGALRLSARGRASDESPDGTLRGTASLEVTEGVLASADLLAGLTSALRQDGTGTPESRETPFDRFSADFDIRDRRLATSNLEFRSPDLDLDGSGTVGFDLALDLDVTAAASREATEALLLQAPQLEFRVGDEGRLTIPMRVEGTLAQPRVTVDLQRVIEEGLGRRLRDKLKGLFRRR